MKKYRTIKVIQKKKEILSFFKKFCNNNIKNNTSTLNRMLNELNELSEDKNKQPIKQYNFT